MSGQYEHHFTVVGTIEDGEIRLVVDPEAGWYPDGTIWDTEAEQWLNPYTGKDDDEDHVVAVVEEDNRIWERLVSCVAETSERAQLRIFASRLTLAQREVLNLIADASEEGMTTSAIAGKYQHDNRHLILEILNTLECASLVTIHRTGDIDDLRVTITYHGRKVLVEENKR